MPQPFNGITVLEFSQVISGPMAATLMGFQGARVIKIESPGEGDQGRRIMDGGPLAGQNMSPLYQGLNTGKQSLSLNLKHPRATEIVRRLVERADVFIENLRPGVMPALGFGYEAIRAIRADIIYCSISGFGQTGPQKLDAAYDGAVQAASGMMLVNGMAEQGPLRVGFPAVDVAAGMNAAFAIASALFRRAQCGEGQYIDVGMLESAFQLMSPVVNSYLIAGIAPVQLGNMSVSRQPTADVFPTKEGFLQVTALTPLQLRSFWTAIGLPELADDPRNATVDLQHANAAALRAEAIEALSHRTVLEWVETLNAAKVPCSPVWSVPEALAQPQVAARTIVQQPGNPLGIEGLAPAVLNAAFMASPDGPRVTTAAPLVGQDTDAVLMDLGYSAAEIADMREGGVL